MPSLLECKRTPRRSPKHLLQGQKNHPRHHIAGLTQKPLQFHKIYLKKKNIYIYNIHIIQFFSTAAHFAFPKNLKASPVARKHVARPRWCDCSARILILWCPRFVIYSRTLTPQFPTKIVIGNHPHDTEFLKPSWKTTHVHNEVLCFFPHQNRSLFFEVRPRHESKYECKCSLANIVYAIQLRSVAVKQKFCMQRKVVTQNKVHSTNPCAWTQCTQ